MIRLIVPAVLMALALPASAQVTLTAAASFSTNGAGNVLGTQVWSTEPVSGNCCFALWLALQPNASLPVNGPSDTQSVINIPLTAGNTYHYYIFGAPGGFATGTNALNLFFDGNNSTPGISAYGFINGFRFRPDGLTTRTPSGALVPGSGTTYYTSGGVTVILTSYNWHTPTNPPGDVCQPYVFTPGGGLSYHGSFTLRVGPAAALQATGTTLTGSGFAPLERVNIYVGSLDSAPLAATNADASGAFAITAAVPGGGFEVYAVGRNSGKLGATSVVVH